MNLHLFRKMLFLGFGLLPAAASLGMIWSLYRPFVFAQPNSPSSERTSKQKAKVPPPPPPPSRGVPGNRTTSASMSGNSCELKLVALAPEFTSQAPGQVPERSVWGKTTVSHPTFWFFVPATPKSTQLEFILQDREEIIYRAPLSPPQHPGIIGIRIPANQKPLQLDRNYRWTLKAKIPCGQLVSHRVFVDGWVTRVSLPGLNPRDFAAQGIWYDAITNVARQRLQRPKDRDLKQNWSDLLESGNLETIADQPLLN